MVNLRRRVLRLERRERINRRWAAAHKEIARREQKSRRLLADWRRRQVAVSEDLT